MIFKSIFIFLLFISTICYSQIEVKGYIQSNSKTPIENVLIRVYSNKDSTFLKSNNDGFYRTLNEKNIVGDTIFVETAKEGFISTLDTLLVKSLSNDLNIMIEEDPFILLDEVKLTNFIKQAANKTTYSINQNDYLKTNDATDVLATLPNVTSIDGIGVKVDGTKDVLLFIDGLESREDDLKKLNVGEISKIEVISNPSASYDTTFNGAVINIVTKTKKEQSLKGELEASKSLRLERWGFFPTVSYKSKNISLKVLYSYNEGNQQIVREINRNNNENIFYNHNTRVISGYQDYFNAIGKLSFDKKSDLILTGGFWGYNFDGKTNGLFLENNVEENYSVIDNEKTKSWNVSSIYSYQFDDRHTLRLKLKHLQHKTRNEAHYETQDLENHSDVFSNTDETTAEITIENNSFKLFNLPLEYKFGYKSIFRKFKYQSDFYDLSQNIYDIYFDLNYQITKSFYGYLSLVGDFTENQSYENINQKYNYLLPSLSFKYELSSGYKLELNYSKRITRPSPHQINPSIILFNPGQLIKGNENLQPQLRNYYELGLSKKYKTNTFASIKVFNEYIPDAITDVIINDEENNYVINSFDNAGKFDRYGINLSFTTKIFDLISVNANGGVSKYTFKSDNTDNLLVSQNGGYSFNGSFRLGALINQKYSISFSGFYFSPYYSLSNKRKKPISLNFSAERSFFNDKLNVNLSYNDMFNLSSVSEDELSYTNYYQNLRTTNKLSNATLTVRYIFGKNFNDNIQTQTINNNDIQLKQ